MSYHYLNAIDDDEREWLIEEDDEDDDEKINKRFIPQDYTFYKIYKDGCESYIGSTVNYNSRKSIHKSDCNNTKSKKYNFPVYKYIRANGGYNTFNYEILDKKFVCKKDAEIYEGELMKIHNSTLNKLKNYSDDDKKQYNKNYSEKYREKNPEYNKQKTKQYLEKNPDYNKQKSKKYYEKKKQEKQNQITINITINLPQN
jgi:hypothetical protein